MKASRWRRIGVKKSRLVMKAINWRQEKPSMWEKFCTCGSFPVTFHNPKSRLATSGVAGPYMYSQNKLLEVHNGLRADSNRTGGSAFNLESTIRDFTHYNLQLDRERCPSETSADRATDGRLVSCRSGGILQGHGQNRK